MCRCPYSHQFKSLPPTQSSLGLACSQKSDPRLAILVILGTPGGAGLVTPIWICFCGKGGADEILVFQFCYDKNRQERMVSWSADSGYLHCLIDDGEASPKRNMSPILLVNAAPYSHDLVSRFCANVIGLDPQIIVCVAQHLNLFLKLSRQSEVTENTKGASD